MFSNASSLLCPNITTGTTGTLTSLLTSLLNTALYVLNLIFLVKQVISKVQAKFNVRPLWGNLVKKLIENAFKHLHLAIFYS